MQNISSMIKKNNNDTNDSATRTDKPHVSHNQMQTKSAEWMFNEPQTNEKSTPQISPAAWGVGDDKAGKNHAITFGVEL